VAGEILSLKKIMLKYSSLEFAPSKIINKVND
jgi:hypothetical protein